MILKETTWADINTNQWVVHYRNLDRPMRIIMINHNNDSFLAVYMDKNGTQRNFYGSKGSTLDGEFFNWEPEAPDALTLID